MPRLRSSSLTLSSSFRLCIFIVAMFSLLFIFKEGSNFKKENESIVMAEDDTPLKVTVLEPDSTLDFTTKGPDNKEQESKPYPKDFVKAEKLDHLIEQQPGDLKKILLWNPFFGEPDYGVGGFGTAAFENSECPVTCFTTNNHSELAYAEAVVLHSYNMGERFQNVTPITRQSRDQIFVFFILESPLRSYKGFYDTAFDFQDTFNLTFSYLDDEETDIFIPMGGYKPAVPLTPEKVLSMTKIKNKKYPVAWFVSNCKAPSAREDYFQEMANYIPVHVYGQCGNYTCEQGDYKCFVEVMRTYMFYLSAENSFCKDYVTEKAYRTLKATEMVPVVYGLGNYTKHMPPHSFIDVRDYDSPKDLAKYLLYLQRNPEEYQKYFLWKKDYTILQEGDYKALGFCKLCEILHTKDYRYKSRYDVTEYWNPSRFCLLGDDEKRAVHLIK